MKKLITILLILSSFAAGAQLFPPGYTGINQRYDWLSGKFRGIHIPAGGAPVMLTGQYTGAGALFLDTVDTEGTPAGLYVYMNNSWSLVQGGGSGGGFFGNETAGDTATTKDANGQSYTLTGVDIFSLSGNTLLFSPVDSVVFENLPIDGAEETEPEITNLAGFTENGKLKRASSDFGKFGLQDNLGTSNRLFNAQDNSLTITAGADGQETYFVIDPYWVRMLSQYGGAKTEIRVQDGELIQIFGNAGDETDKSGFFIDNSDPSNPLVSVNSYGNIEMDASVPGNQITFNSPTISMAFASPDPNSGHWLVANTFQHGSASHVLVYDSANNEVKYVSIDSIAGSGGGGFFTPSTATANTTQDAENTIFRIIDAQEFGVRATSSGSTDRIRVDASGTLLVSNENNAFISAGDGRIDLDAATVNVPSLAGVGSRHVGVNADGDLVIISAGGGSGGDGISQVVAGFGLENINDSTLAIDTADADLKEWIEGLVTPNLIATSIGTEGIGVLDPRNDSLLYRRITTESDLVTVDTLATGEISIGIDSTALAGFVEDHSVGGTGVTLTDDPLALEEEFAMGIDTIRHRSFIKERNVVRWGPITDSAFTLSQLSTPGSFAASPASDVQINLTWTDVLNEMGYQIYRNTVNDFGTATLINSPAADATSYNSTGLTASTLYYYWILAEGDGVVFSNSNTATTSATTNAGLDADASNYLSRVAAHGVTVSTPQQNAVNQLFLDLKAASIYTLYYDMYFFGWGNAAANGEPLKGVAPDITWNGTVTHNSSGVTGNGTTGFGNTGIIPSSVLTLNNTHLSIKTSTSSSAAIVDIGARGASSTVRLDLLASSGSNLIGQFNSNTAGAGQISASAPNSLGSSMVSRVSSTDLRAYRNGIQIGSTATTTNNGTMPGVAIYVCATNNNGTAASFSARTYQGCTIGFGMSPTEVLAHYEAFDDFYTAMGF